MEPGATVVQQAYEEVVQFLLPAGAQGLLQRGEVDARNLVEDPDGLEREGGHGLGQLGRLRAGLPAPPPLRQQNGDQDADHAEELRAPHDAQHCRTQLGFSALASVRGWRRRGVVLAHEAAEEASGPKEQQRHRRGPLEEPHAAHLRPLEEVPQLLREPAQEEVADEALLHARGRIWQRLLHVEGEHVQDLRQEEHRHALGLRQRRGRAEVGLQARQRQVRQRQHPVRQHQEDAHERLLAHEAEPLQRAQQRVARLPPGRGQAPLGRAGEQAYGVLDPRADLQHGLRAAELEHEGVVRLPLELRQ
mmetsp:Transcript_67873/g.198612  ORF Transcript_67873/g.198612 Transcript_67873/m.198612 type:complete len:305 (+) Transcript_67873:483-1397(+)